MKKYMQHLLIGLLAIFLLSCTSSTPQEDTRPVTPIAQLPNKAQQCGGTQGQTCGADEYCKTSIGACNVAHSSGTCTAKTPFCTKEYRPVCGCDGKTYGNQCTAGAAGVSVNYAGECK